VSMLWIAALFTLYAEGRSNGRTHLKMLVSLLVLGVTLSTTAGWILLVSGFDVYLTSTQRKFREVASLCFHCSWNSTYG